MTEKKQSFEESLASLQQIVEHLQSGDVPLEEAMDQFQTGVALSKKLEQTLTQAQEKLTKVMSEDGQETDFQLNAQTKQDKTTDE